MLLPGLGEQNISARMRLTFALILAAMLLPLHRNAYHIDPGALGPALVMLVEEILIGAMLGITARLTISALEVAGSVIAQQLGLGFVTAVDPTQGEQGVDRRQFPDHARHHAVLRHRHAPPRHRRAQRQLHSVRAGRGARHRRCRGAHHQDGLRRVSHRHSAFRAVSGVRASVQHRARRAVAADAADAGVLRRAAAVDPDRADCSWSWCSAR